MGQNILLIAGYPPAQGDRVMGSMMHDNLHHALRLWRSGAYDMIAVVGGRTRPIEVQSQPEANIMFGWLVENGVPREVIRREWTSVDTYENVHHVVDLVVSDSSAADTQITIVAYLVHSLRFYITFRRVYRGLDVRLAPLRKTGGLSRLLTDVLGVLLHLVNPNGGNWYSKWIRERRRRQARR